MANPNWFLICSESLESLDICRQVSPAWIIHSLLENRSKKWGAIIRRSFERSWDVNLPLEEQISKALQVGEMVFTAQGRAANSTAAVP